MSSQNPGKFADASADPAIKKQVKGMNALQERQAKAVADPLPNARVVKLPGANHYVYLSDEADVLREMRSFLARVP